MGKAFCSYRSDAKIIPNTLLPPQSQIVLQTDIVILNYNWCTPADLASRWRCYQGPRACRIHQLAAPSRSDHDNHCLKPDCIGEICARLRYVCLAANERGNRIKGAAVFAKSLICRGNREIGKLGKCWNYLFLYTV